VKRDDGFELRRTDLRLIDVDEDDGGAYSCEIEADSEYPVKIQHRVEILGEFGFLPFPGPGRRRRRRRRRRALRLPRLRLLLPAVDALSFHATQRPRISLTEEGNWDGKGYRAYTCKREGAPPSRIPYSCESAAFLR